MAAYPTLNAQRSSSTARNSGHDAVRATNGALKVRRMFSAEKTDFTIDHWLTSAEKSTLESFYQANKDLDVAFTWAEDGVTYTVRFASAPQFLGMPGWWQARVRLLQV
jgi:hypothetical protein